MSKLAIPYIMPYLAICLLCTMLLPSLALAEEAPATDLNTPEALARAALLSIKEGRIKDYGQLMHPEAMKQLKEIMLPIVEGAAQEGAADQLLALFANVESVEDLRAVSDQEFFVAFFQGVMQVVPQLSQVMQQADMEVIGHVAEGADTVHVVYRIKLTQEELKVTKLSVLTAKSDKGQWKLMLTGEVEGVAAALQRQFGGKE